MTHPARPFVLLISCGLLVLACKKDAEPQAVPVPSGAAAAQPSAAAEATQAPSASAAPAPPPPPVVQAQPIDGCCSALSSAAKAAKKPADKEKFDQAAKICSGIAAKVKSGQSQRASALVTIRSQLAGVGVPNECH